ncbi:hypothetical protein ACFWNC_14770 [Streptomyces sp. NPDC058369]|uniref:hypothetical protein n=1 Tax=Streptomyces sp. NPDC058369 TaxID=3346462 RepID=UPI00365BA2C3
MTDFDPTDPWGTKSPWDEAQPNQTQTPEAPVTNVVENADSVTLSFKGGSGHDASLLVLRAANASALNQMLDREAATLKEVVEKAARVQAYSTAVNQAAKGQVAPQAPPAAQPTFNPNSGQVQYNQAPEPPFGGGSDLGVTTCMHGPRTHRAGANWEAMFCPERDKSAQCPPAWKDKKTGKYAVKS